jgi:hypothetical protein
MRKQFSILLLILLSASQLLAAQPTKFEVFKKKVAQKVSAFTKKAKEIANPALVIVTGLFGISLYLFIKNNRSRPAQPVQPVVPAPPAGTNPAPVVEDCSICQTGLNTGIRTILACNHTFHQDCINLWFAERGQNRNCPNCRRPVAPQPVAAQPVAQPVQQPVALPVVEPARPAAPQARAVPQVVRIEPPVHQHERARNPRIRLRNAAGEGNLALLEEALRTGGLEDGIGVNAFATDDFDSPVENALMIAARTGHLAVVNRLLRAPSIDVNARNALGFTALMYAVQNVRNAERLAIVERLLQVPGINVNACDTGGWSTLRHSFDCGNGRVPQLLREHGATE